MSKKKTLILLSLLLLLLILLYCFVSLFKKNDSTAEENVPYPYFHWFVEPVQSPADGVSETQASTNNVIVFHQDQ